MIIIYLYDPLFLGVLYPDLRVYKGGAYVGHGWVYDGKERIVGDPGAFWLVSSPNKAEIKILSREDLVKHAYSRKGKKCPDRILKRILNLSREELIGELKLFMTLGRWKNLSCVNLRVYQLFDAMCESKSKFLCEYFRLRDELSFNVLWSSILTFFIRVIDVDEGNDPNVSAFYKSIILRFKDQSGKLKSVVDLLLRNHFDELMALDFILGIRM